MREMPTQVGSTGNNGGAEGLPKVQESVLEHAAPEANQTSRLAGRLANRDYPENSGFVNVGTVRKTDTGYETELSMTKVKIIDAEPIVKASQCIREISQCIREAASERLRFADALGN